MGNGWVRFSIDIDYVYKENLKQSKKRLRRNTKYVYVLENDLRCKCPKIRLNKTYVMIGINEAPDGHDGLLLDRDSIVVKYKRDYDKNLKYYKKEERRQSCYRLI